MDKRKNGKRYFVMKHKKIAVGKNEAAVIAMYFVFTLGMILGAFLIRKQQSTSSLYLLCEKLFQLKKQQGTAELFCTVLLYDLSFVVFSVLLGLSAIGTAFTFAAVLIKGTVLSVILSYLCTAYKLKGLGYAALVIIPPQIISTLALIFSLIKSISFSLGIFEKGLSTLTRNSDNKTAAYFKFQGIVICAVCAASLAQTALSSLFSSFFGI